MSCEVAALTFKAHAYYYVNRLFMQYFNNKGKIVVG